MGDSAKVTGFNALRGTMIVQLFNVERSVESMSGEISYIVKVIDIGPLIDDTPLGFKQGDYIKLKSLEGFRWEWEDKMFHACGAENAQMKVDGYMVITEGDEEIRPYE